MIDYKDIPKIFYKLKCLRNSICFRLIIAKLEYYNSAVWCPYLKTHFQYIETVQNRLMHFKAFKIWYYTSFSLSIIVGYILYFKLIEQKETNHLKCLSKLLNEFVVRPESFGFIIFFFQISVFLNLELYFLIRTTLTRTNCTLILSTDLCSLMIIDDQFIFLILVLVIMSIFSVLT